MASAQEKAFPSSPSLPTCHHRPSWSTPEGFRSWTPPAFWDWDRSLSNHICKTMNVSIPRLTALVRVRLAPRCCLIEGQPVLEGLACRSRPSQPHLFHLSLVLLSSVSSRPPTMLRTRPSPTATQVNDNRSSPGRISCWWPVRLTGLWCFSSRVSLSRT